MQIEIGMKLPKPNLGLEAIKKLRLNSLSNYKSVPTFTKDDKVGGYIDTLSNLAYGRKDYTVYGLIWDDNGCVIEFEIVDYEGENFWVMPEEDFRKMFGMVHSPVEDLIEIL